MGKRQKIGRLHLDSYVVLAYLMENAKKSTFEAISGCHEEFKNGWFLSQITMGKPCEMELFFGNLFSPTKQHRIVLNFGLNFSSFDEQQV